MSETKTQFKPISIEKANTPKGIAIFPWLNTPDTKFKAEGEFRVKLRLEGQVAEDFIAHVDALFDKAIDAVAKEKGLDAAKKKKLKLADKPYKQATDKDGNDIEGAYDFTFKSKASYKNKQGTVVNRKVPMFDAKGTPINVVVYGGSELKVRYEASAFFSPAFGSGVSLRLEAVQIINLRTSGSSGGSADEFGFGEEEGYTAAFGEEPAGSGQESKGTGGTSSEDDEEF